MDKCPTEQRYWEPNKICTNLCTKRVYNASTYECIENTQFCEFMEYTYVKNKDGTINEDMTMIRCDTKCSEKLL